MYLLAKVANHLVRTSRCAAQTRQNRHACVMVPRALKQRQPLLPPEPDAGGVKSHLRLGNRPVSWVVSAGRDAMDKGWRID